MSNITLNIVEPGGPTPIDPVVPNTGLFTSGIGGAEAAIIATVGLVAILAIIGAIIYYRKHKQGKVSNIFAKCKHAPGLAVLALLVSIATVAGLIMLTTSAIEGDATENTEDSSALTVDVSSTELTIELADEPVFAMLPVELTVAEATEAGYTLTAYTENTDLVSTTDSSKVIPMVTADEAELVALTDNTYGLALGEEPTSKDAEVYTSLSADSLNPTIIKSMTEYIPTSANDTTTIYYGFYITPDTPYGTYTGSDIYYDTTINTTLVTFNGNDLYFNNDTEQTTNMVEYIAVAQEESEGTINQIISGEYLEPSQALPYNFLGWSEEQEATTPTYTSAEDIAQNLPILPNQPIILYAIWQKATTITFDNNGGTGTMTTQTIIAGESDNLNPNEFTREGYTFTGWNTVATPTEQEPGKAYADQAEYTAPADSGYVTLYAQWEKKLPVIGDLTEMQDFAKLSEAGKASVLASMTPGQQYQLKDNRDQTMYYIAKLADKNVWMTQNLDFSITNNGTGLDSTNTDVPDNWNDAGKLANTYTTGTTWNNSTTAPESYDPGNLYWNGNITTSGGNLSNSTTTEPSATYGTHYHVGNYYNWTAAVAMSNSSSYTSDLQEVNQSICPAGWRLPTYSGDKSYLNLKNTQGFTSGTSGNIQNTPTYFVYAGAWNGSSNLVGSRGSYWSSVVKTSYNSYQLRFSADGSLSPQGNGGREYGYSLRCVAR